MSRHDDGERLRQIGGEQRPNGGTDSEESERAALHHNSIHKHRAGQYALAVIGTLAAFAAIILLALGTAGFVRTTQLAETNRDILQTQIHDRAIARDATCLIFERAYQRSVRQLKNTYAYLVQSRTTEHSTEQTQLLYQFVVAGLPQTEQEARDNLPPFYCRPPDIGSAKPFPKLPSRPALLADLP